MSPASEERRKSRRVSFPCDARCYGVGEALRDARLTDVSSAGAFIETATEMPEGSILLLRFKVEGKAVKLEVEVVHHVPERGLGVRFVNVGPAERQTIESIANTGGAPSSA